MKNKDLVNFIVRNDYIKNKTTFKDQLKMIKWVSTLSECELRLLFEQEEEITVKVPKPSTLTSKILHIGLFMASTQVFAGKAILMAVEFLVQDYNYKCAIKCRNNTAVRNKSICNRECKVKSLSYIVMKLGAEYNKCNSTPDPGKCRKRMLGIIKSYRNKRNREAANLELAKRKARLKGDI